MCEWIILTEGEEISDEEDKPVTPKVSPRKSKTNKPRRTKEELKEQLREQKVMEKRMALRRRRIRNRKYMSDEYESIFTERKNLFSSEHGYENVEVKCHICYSIKASKFCAYNQSFRDIYITWPSVPSHKYIHAVMCLFLRLFQEKNDIG